MDNFREGQTYYRLTFVDAGLTIPGLEPMVFIGKDILPNDSASSGMYYFQDVVSYFNSDWAPEPLDQLVYSFTENERSGIHTLESAANEINAALARANANGSTSNLSFDTSALRRST